MISLSKIGSSGSATKYYLDEEKDKNITDVELSKSSENDISQDRESDEPLDRSSSRSPNNDEHTLSQSPPPERNASANYYLRPVEAKDSTEWYGKLSEQAGLLGSPVSHSDLKEVLGGSLKGEDVHYKRDNHKSGIDLTFSAPKSVSLLSLVGGDTRLVDAHNAAIKDTLSQIEKDIAQVKGTDEDGKTTYTNTEQMLFAMVQHKTSREDEPHLHTHALATNLTRDMDGKLRSLATCLKQSGSVTNGSFERLYNNQKYYTSLYQSNLAKSVVDMGYEIRGTGNGLFEIKGVPESVLADNSTRSAQINEKSDELGLDSQTARDLIAKSTRKAKTGFSANDLQSSWQSKVGGKGFDIQSFIVRSYAQSSTQEQSITQETKDAVHRSIDHLSAFSTSMTFEKLVTLAVTEFAKEGFVNAQEAKEYLHELNKSGDLIKLDKQGESYTTQSMIDREKKLVDTVSSRTTDMKGYANENALKSHQLNTDNEKAIVGIIESKKQFNVLNLPHSAEKAVKSLVHVYNNSGKNVDIVSPNLAAAERAKDSYKRESFGMFEVIKNYFKPEHTHTVSDYLKSDKFGSGVLIVESANKLSANQLTELAAKAKDDGRKVVFLNHESQTQSFRSNSALALVSSSGAHTEVFRSETDTQAQVSLRDQDIDKLASQYSAMALSGERPQVVATNVKDTNLLNSTIRDKLVSEGQVSSTGMTIKTLNPVYLSDAQRELSKHYNSTMTLREFSKSKGKTTVQDFKVVSKNNGDNTITLENDKGQKQTIDPSSKEFKERNISVLKSAKLEVSQGDMLAANSNNKVLGLSQQHSYTVESTKNGSLTLTDSQTNKTIAINKPENLPLSYGYATPSHKADPNSSHNFLYAKDYAINKEIISELALNSKTLDVFTTEHDKVAKRFDESHVRPSAVQRVFNAQSIDRKVTEQTSDTLKQDLSVAIDKLQMPDSRTNLEKAVDYAINHLSEREAAFTQQDLMYHSIQYLMQEKGSPVEPSEIVNQFDKHKDLLSSVYSDGTRWTTEKSLVLEKSVLSTLAENKAVVEPYSTKAQADSFLASNDFLTRGQSNSISMIATTDDRFVAVQGLAGTGKSTMLEKNVELINQVKQMKGLAEVEVFGLAPTHAAVNELSDKGISAQTMSQFLTDISKGKVEPSDFKGSLFFVDEDSMIGNKQLSEFLSFVVASDSKAVFVGDREQLLSQSSGKPIELAVDRGAISYSNLTDIRRQDTPELLKGVHNIVDKQGESAVEALRDQKTESIVNSHVYSTKMDYTNNPLKNAQIAKEEVTRLVSKDYLSRTPEARENTLVIAYTNRERDDIASSIRAGLQKSGELPTEQITLGRFRQVSASREELSTMMPYEKGLVLATGKNTFYDIINVDKESKILTLKEFGNPDSKETYFIPSQRDHKFTNLFSYSEKPVSVGDRVMPRFTDNGNEIKANTEFKVSSIDTQTNKAVFTNQDGKSISVGSDDKQSMFWDYSYTRTADMAQGSTYQSVISAILGKGALTDIRRAYIDISRAVSSMQIYTDNAKQMMNAWVNNRSDKFSALQTLDKQETQPHLYFNDRPTPNENYQYHDINGELSLSKMRDTLVKDSSPYIESISQSLLGEPNKSKSTSDYLVFGQGNSNTRVTLTGEFRGFYRDYETGKGGSIVNLLMDRQNLSYRDALYELDYQLRDPEKHNLAFNPQYEKLENAIPQSVQNSINTAIKIASNSTSIQGTLAQTYLEKNGASLENISSLKYNDSVWTREDGKTYPALISEITNSANEISGIEIRYLSANGDLADLNTPIRTLGSRSENSIVLNESESNTTVISSDVIDGLKVVNATKNVDVISTANLYDVTKLDTNALRENIILVLSETNNQHNNDLINNILEHFQDKNLDIISTSDIQDKALDIIENNKDNIERDTTETLDSINISDNDKYSDSNLNDKSYSDDIIQNHDTLSTPDMPSKENDIPQQDIDNDLDIEKEL
ncbi:conjugative transfer relaxase/helicase TraI [Photobacterium makurazakiensis]|uniref:conjugative transfer relaxase/helicase TraI n=1 Tax=Photobacterium makurazakiensis TaxID=2910234 RepID=UPI003D136446